MWVFIRKLSGIVLLLLAASAGGFLLTGSSFWKWLTVLLATLTYHILMRSAVANTCNAIMHNHADCRSRWFRVTDREQRLYRRLRVKQWKNKVPTYDPESFNVRTHSWDEIAQTTCQSEVVHETNICLSYLPAILARWTGGVRLQLAAAVFATAVESCFVMIQRYNRGRILKLMDRQARRISGKTR